MHCINHQALHSRWVSLIHFENGQKKKQRNQITNELVNSILPAVQKMLLAIKNDSSKLIEPKHTFVPSNSFLCHTFFFLSFFYSIGTIAYLMFTLCSATKQTLRQVCSRATLRVIGTHTHTKLLKKYEEGLLTDNNNTMSSISEWNSMRRLMTPCASCCHHYTNFVYQC